MIRTNGLYYADAFFSSSSPSGTPPSAISSPEAASAIAADDMALIWAARLGTDDDGLLKLAKATHGIGITSLSPRQRELIKSNLHRAIAQAKHGPVHATPLNQRATEPAATLICDGFGKHHAASPVDGAVYQFSAVCEHTSFGYIASGKTHTIDDWVSFLRHVQLDAKSHGHAITRVRFDRAPELESPKLKARIEAELGILVELTSREHHEGVGRAERNHDTLTRIAEEMLQRCDLGTQWLLPARAYAQWLLNRRIISPSGETRYQRYLRRIPDFSSTIPYAFGTTVAIVEDVRGPKGSLDHPRGSIGRLVGIEGSSYIVYRPQRGGVVHQHTVRPLNELALIRSSVPSAAATVEAETQTEASIEPGVAVTINATQPAAPPPAPPPPPVIELPIGQRVEVLWPVKGSSTPVWYAGRIESVHDQLNGKRRHRIAYEGWPESQWYLHDLASDDFEWRKLGATADSPPPAQQRPRTRAQSRLRADAHAASLLADDALECQQGEPSPEVFNAALFQVLGPDAASFECSSAESLDQCRQRLHDFAAGLGPPLEMAEASAADAATDSSTAAHELLTVPIFSAALSAAAAECYKASQNIIDIATPLGTSQLAVPGTYKQLLQSEQREQWLAAEQVALDAILAHPGNRMVPTSVPAALGAPVARCVTQRRLKVDPATKQLASKNAFKSRHCVDGGHLSMLLKQRLNSLKAARTGGDASAFTSPDFASANASDMLIKMLIGDAAVRNRNLVKADVPNAYPQGKRLGRGKTYMQLPAAFAWMRADDGSPLCIELETPMWGEGPAGFEWQVELERTLEELGWQRAEAVPALWKFTAPEGDCLLVTIVDDLLFSESASSGHAIAERTCAALSQKYGDVGCEREPTSYSGYKLTRDRTAGTIKLSLPQKIIEAAREHAPELIDGNAAALSLPHGQRLQRLADSLTLAPKQGGKLTRKQQRTQMLIGSLKFCERCHPRITLILHRLSCVMSSPPPEAWTAALAALEAIFNERDVGITFGGAGLATAHRIDAALHANIDLNEPAPAELAAHADATWGDRNVYGLIVTFAGGSILHQTKKINLIVDSSMEVEALASGKGGETIAHAREVLRAFGTPPVGPTLISTDNLANHKVGSGIGAPARSKHFLRRYHSLKRRIADGECTLVHVPDPQMPADFLTKWIPNAKLEASLRYACNAHGTPAAVAASHPPAEGRASDSE